MEQMLEHARNENAKNNTEENEEALFNIRREIFKEAGVLLDATRGNDFEKVKTLLCYNDNSPEKVKFRKWYVNQKAKNDWIALHGAAEGGWIDLFKLLMDCGSEINAQSDVIYTPLHLGTLTVTNIFSNSSLGNITNLRVGHEYEYYLY